MPGTLQPPPPPPLPPFLAEPSLPPRPHPAAALAPYYPLNRRSPTITAAFIGKIIHALSAERHKLRYQLELKTYEVARLRHELGETRRRANADIATLCKKVYEMEKERLTWRERGESTEEEDQGQVPL
ncbi:hypothetical protein MMYC01_200681 [Madurella mycetomatis]|uniref:Uncharacterized protein n=1 Tax=Madurella mycetomatis TaxID=100816 RepID=A0A175WDI8_9PEZI|nr:hypothetical protein MMYC01_200681 [Madurella mycetomatis]